MHTTVLTIYINVVTVTSFVLIAVRSNLIHSEKQMKLANVAVSVEFVNTYNNEL